MANITGTAGNDTRNGTAAADLILGLAGADVLNGLGGADTLRGGSGNDRLDGGAGTDTASWLDATTGGVSASLVTNSATGAGGADTLVSIENLEGSNRNDTLTGNSGANTLWGRGGADTLDGGNGHDVLAGGAGNDRVDGGAGTDTATWFDATGAVNASLAANTASGGGGSDALLNIENLAGSSWNDTLTGNGGANVLLGGNGFDTLRGGAGTDTLDGGAGNDSLVGEAGNDGLLGGAGNDFLQGGVGNDRLDGGAGTDTASWLDVTGGGITASLVTNSATGAGGSDTLVSIENLEGSHQNDSLLGNTAANTLWGSGGDDSLDGGAGDDLIYGGNGSDSLEGGAGQDSLRGWLGDDTLFGGNGNDVVEGDDGDDALDGGEGNDIIKGGNGNDHAYVSSGGDDTYFGGAGDDYFDGYTGAETFFGEAGDDSLRGYSGNDTVSGGADSDRISGGDGDDLLGGGAANGTPVFASLTAPAPTGISFDARFVNVKSVSPTTPGGFGWGYGTQGGQLGLEHIELPGPGSGSLAGSGSSAVFQVGRLKLAEDPGRNNDGRAFIHTLEGGGIDMTKPFGSPNAPDLDFAVFVDVDVAGLTTQFFFDAKPWVQAGSNTNPTPGYVDDPDIDYYLTFAPRTATLANGAKVEVSLNDIAFTDNGELPLNATVRLLTAPDKALVDDGPDSIDGGDGTDTVWGGTGDDTIVGGSGRDVMAGGAGADTFVFYSTSEIGSGSNIDRIEDFARAQRDKIDLSVIDADPYVQGGDQVFIFLDTGAFTGRAGELRIAHTHFQGITYVELDLDGNRTADAKLELGGVQVLEAKDFIL